ncbi:4-(cytidine 5'-diphospho)-2-C-methyl-D-erythritol kinase [candidate division LCP-89 bacterium B3_LCP]|uniref:4-diphosphocytidyl-2-C-methyl-D-erythritol kinase n=1 Tax=candidate division LCP-89 bacterium B3_LCP TaxID=2012998 RepID=A0A532UZJ8_UNCL8|nr:MAG: 4-(cytidine 5'-diphospho)-2-C-methyl-D-erythritol kinase [candidate division LCP-89 bacterium B3_LCP]
MLVRRKDKSELQISTPAKINIGLRIFGRRDDGYHEIWSILQPIDLFDEIILQDVPDFSISMSCDSDVVPCDAQNLCVKSAKLLQEYTQCERGVHIHLTKNIPVGAGLGGGSSDAAATLAGLNLLWNTKLASSTLMELAAQIGSDVPFFLMDSTCIATGRGERLRKINRIVSDPIVLICPAINVSTAWAYKNMKKFSLTSETESINFQDSLASNVLDNQQLLVNDFEEVVFARYPVLSAHKYNLLQNGAYYASLSGSGSSLYGIFNTIGEARKAAEELKNNIIIYILR